MKSILDDKENRSLLTRMPHGVRVALYITTGVLALALLVFLFRVCLQNLYRKNETFLLQEIAINVENDALRDAVSREIALHHIQVGETYLPQMELAPLHDALCANARIADARLRRIYPHTLRVEIEPRIPAAILRFPSGKAELLLDGEGMVLPGNVPTPTRLPIVLGLNPDDFHEGEKCQNKAALAILTFLRESKIRPEGCQYEVLSAIMDEKNEKMTLTLQATNVFRPGNQVVLPLDNVPQEMDRVQVIVELSAAKNETIRYINAVYENIPVLP